jgi:SAM-dependent methyltransferase
VGEKLDLVTGLHTSTKRDYLSRMVDDKVLCMGKAKEYEADYWDGDRRFGYGGYRYDGRWKPVAQRLIAHYGLTGASRILDLGCGKAHLLHELKLLLPGAEVLGLDISAHGLATAPEAIRPFLRQGRAQDPLPFPDKHFDLVLSLGCVFNLEIDDLAKALGEIERVGRRAYVMVESYRNDRELFNLQCWALTCESFFSEREWIWLFGHFGYTGDFEFIFFE